MEAVSRAVDYIHAGDIFQVVPSQRLSAELGVHPFALYRAPARGEPEPVPGLPGPRPGDAGGEQPPKVWYAVTAKMSKPCRLPERANEAGTPPKMKRLAAELLDDAKERAEHIMLVDLGRNDLGRVCKFGSVKVTDLMRVERYSHVMHLVSTVEGTLAEGKTPLDALASTLPMGTASGAPKIRAMEIIDELEPTRRGPYAGAFGYVSAGGAMDMALTLRTAVITGGMIHLQAGGRRRR